MMETTIPRVLASTLPEYVGKSVLLIGEILGFANGSVRIRAADGGEIMGSYSPGETFETKYVQIIGKVVNRGNIEIYKIHQIPGDFDLVLYSKAIDILMRKHSELYV